MNICAQLQFVSTEQDAALFILAQLLPLL